MVQLEDIKKVYFIGIGGIGMSAIARYFKFHGRSVSGYDKTETVLTKQLVAEGIPVHYDDNLELAPKDADLVVYTPAIPKDHSELNFYRDNKYVLMKRSEVLGVITEGSFNICVAGTHGKTTISTMIAHLLRHTGYGCNAFLGGVAVNYNSNYWSDKRNVCVVEADEYDRSFLRLSPDIAVITAMDADHLDIYGTPEAMEDAYIEFSRRVKKGGWMISKHGLKRSAALESTHQLTYSLLDQGSDIRAENIRMENGSYHFNVVTRLWHLNDITLNMGGLHNIENVIAAIMIAHHLGIADDKIKAAVADFKGVKRRFEYMIKTPSLVFVDDYAHHPEELRALISGARKLFPDKKCTVIFQPHLFTRTRDFAKEFAESLDLADEVVLLPIYPARELPIEGVTSNLILDQMTIENKQILEKAQVLDLIKQQKNDNWLLITAGAGDIDTLLQPIKTILDK
ncbi:UDP-N-acetylmuramate--L-alanine ligase [Pseudobacter ginsenosidimutans]|uniref:UDP-N-acetylmuramate--L-alanine ligase n=1 Tax=Pseudobacter ginsenosidimutans TaxID=661488 RepID=A0A4Q7MQ24_9BACT|nr:UDP-N-acetylmuramate--L-alanine ligase [Pseudobacter ginsenosidimutans]QEC42365.1 UDP-N-acetylmuramate--L-alanine ligase [Pseudobacter ginsenosidimutans]RZS70785.1 UDP-N-acetylmuramate--L-alanine ligase [Pseudobacter ginsenosidimutans]